MSKKTRWNGDSREREIRKRVKIKKVEIREELRKKI
jgi:hypothetical protein